MKKVKNENLKTKKQREADRKGSKKTFVRFLYPAIILAFTFILYGNTFNHYYALDDDIVSRKNAFVQEGYKGIPKIFSKGFLYGFNGRNDQSYRPVSLLTFAAEVGTWGNSPRAHHFFNVLYYALGCVVLFILLKRVFRQYPVAFSLIITLIFAAHPIHTEAVANFKSRDEVLVMGFLFLILIKVFDYLDHQKKYHLLLSLLFFFMALLTKEQAITFIAIVPLFVFFFSSLSLRKIFFLIIPYVAVALFYMVLRWAILDTVTFAEKMSIINNSLSAATNITDRTATAILVLGRYLLLLIFPHPLSWDYSYNQIPIVSFTSPWVILTISIYIALLVYAVIKLKHKDIHSFTYFFFIITISVVSNLFILIGSSLGERFLLTPSLAFCISLIFLIVKFTRTDLSASGFKKATPFFIVVAVLLVLYSVKTVSRNIDWKNNLTLFEAGIKASPNSTRANSSLAYEYKLVALNNTDPGIKKDYYEKARQAFSRSIEIFPGNTEALYNWGVMEYEFKNPAEAEKIYLRLLQVDSNYLNGLNNLAIIYLEREDYVNVLKYFEKILVLTPGDANLVSNIGAVYQRMGNFNKAIEYDEKSISMNPGNATPYNNLIVIYTALGDSTRVEFYRKQKQQRGL